MKRLCLILLAVSFFRDANADHSTQVQAKIDQNEIWIGDSVQLTIILERPQDSRLIVPEIQKYISNFELKNFKVKEENVEGSKIRTILIYVLSCFQPGDYKLGPIPVQLKDQTGGYDEIKTGPLFVRVKSLLDPNLKNPDIRGPKPLLSLERNFFWGYIFLFITLLLIVSVWVIAKKTRLLGIPKVISSTPSLSPSEEALLSLDELLRSYELKEKKMKMVYIRLSEILRQYLGKRFHFNALETTSLECLKELKQRNVRFEMLEHIKKLLSDSDLVKFAKFQPDLEETTAQIKHAKTIINETKEESVEI